jgi:hypothetical protein
MVGHNTSIARGIIKFLQLLLPNHRLSNLAIAVIAERAGYWCGAVKKSV